MQHTLIASKQHVHGLKFIFFSQTIQLAYQDSKFKYPPENPSGIPLLVLGTGLRYHKYYTPSHPNKFPLLLSLLQI
jgi:hypothetical protein